MACGSKNKYQKDMCWKTIGVSAHNLINIWSLVVNIFGVTYITIWWAQELSLNELLYELQIYEDSKYSLDLDLLFSNYLVQIAWFIS